MRSGAVGGIVLVQHHHHRLGERMIEQGSLDLPRVDAEATQLDLLFDPA